ncbi:MAG: hypothetical protein ACW99G_04845 [Candidatus Thorarchaeota archaeon]|jgi:hypothetical protein
MPLGVNKDGTVNFFPEGGDMNKVICPKCKKDKWQYWVIFGHRSEYMCMDCKFKIKHKEGYQYEYTTHRLWDNFPKARKPSRGVYPHGS